MRRQILKLMQVCLGSVVHERFGDVIKRSYVFDENCSIMENG